MSAAPGYVLLEDGTRFEGEACGAVRPVTGEVVFNTAMSGYQESVTDPSYAGQIITFTAPHVGNYGVSAEAMESDRVHARAVVMRAAINREDSPGAERGWLDWLEDCDVPAITGVDTRALVRHIRDAGAMRGGVFPESVPEAEARALVEAEPPMAGRDLAKDVTPAEAVLLEPLGGDPAPSGVGPRIVAIDTGIKTSIVTNLRKRGAFVELHPCSATPSELLARDADAYFLANGPGDPAALDHVVATVRELVGKRPVFGICLGHQLLCRAVGLETFKLPFGHRGANHPVKDLTTGRIEITSQNHGFAVLGPGGERTMDADEPVRWDTDFGAAELTHLNLYDRTVEGLTLLDVPGSTVQYHPEAGPGPHDALYLFDRFLDSIRAAA
ncbi:MAG TPA: glutamine-hydrolyzing carbamoyl-phosphate synthase small subunit [Solirubrobacteraceae bacterium]|nr:glutamine-hydrolyzing carbamoyl-phosphate synthase small subunit [Solirubrobacteraceae bacterium]